MRLHPQNRFVATSKRLRAFTKEILAVVADNNTFSSTKSGVVKLNTELYQTVFSSVEAFTSGAEHPNYLTKIEAGVALFNLAAHGFLPIRIYAYFILHENELTTAFLIILEFYLRDDISSRNAPGSAKIDADMSDSKGDRKVIYSPVIDATYYVVLREAVNVACNLLENSDTGLVNSRSICNSIYQLLMLPNHSSRISPPVNDDNGSDIFDNSGIFNAEFFQFWAECVSIKSGASSDFVSFVYDKTCTTADNSDVVKSVLVTNMRKTNTAAISKLQKLVNTALSESSDARQHVSHALSALVIENKYSHSSLFEVPEHVLREAVELGNDDEEANIQNLKDTGLHSITAEDKEWLATLPFESRCELFLNRVHTSLENSNKNNIDDESSAIEASPLDSSLDRELFKEILVNRNLQKTRDTESNPLTTVFEACIAHSSVKAGAAVVARVISKLKCNSRYNDKLAKNTSNNSENLVRDFLNLLSLEAPKTTNNSLPNKSGLLIAFVNVLISQYGWARKTDILHEIVIFSLNILEFVVFPQDDSNIQESFIKERCAALETTVGILDLIEVSSRAQKTHQNRMLRLKIFADLVETFKNMNLSSAFPGFDFSPFHTSNSNASLSVVLPMVSSNFKLADAVLDLLRRLQGSLTTASLGMLNYELGDLPIFVRSRSLSCGNSGIFEFCTDTILQEYNRRHNSTNKNATSSKTALSNRNDINSYPARLILSNSDLEFLLASKTAPLAAFAIRVLALQIADLDHKMTIDNSTDPTALLDDWLEDLAAPVEEILNGDDVFSNKCDNRCPYDSVDMKVACELQLFFTDEAFSFAPSIIVDMIVNAQFLLKSNNIVINNELDLLKTTLFDPAILAQAFFIACSVKCGISEGDEFEISKLKTILVYSSHIVRELVFSEQRKVEENSTEHRKIRLGTNVMLLFKKFLIKPLEEFADSLKVTAPESRAKILELLNAPNALVKNFERAALC